MNSLKNDCCTCKRSDCLYYRDLDSSGNHFCAFLYVTGMPRACEVKDCDVYKKTTKSEKSEEFEKERRKRSDYRLVNRRY